jgi:hypothetical protein
LNAGVTLKTHISKNPKEKNALLADRQDLGMRFQRLLAKELEGVGQLKEAEIPLLPSRRAQPLLPSASTGMLTALERIESAEPQALFDSAVNRRLEKLQIDGTKTADEDRIRRVLLYIQILDVFEFDSPLVNKAIQWLDTKPNTEKIGKDWIKGESSTCFYATDRNVHSMSATYTKLLIKRYVEFNDIESIYLLKGLIAKGDNKLRQTVRAELAGKYVRDGEIPGEDTAKLLNKHPGKISEIEKILFG